MTERYKTNGQTTLAEDVDGSETAIDLTSVSAVIGATFNAGDTATLKCEDELLRVSAVSSNTVTVARGHGGTSATTHANGTAVYHVIDESALNQIKTDANPTGISANHGQTELGSDFSITGSSGVYQDTLLTITLPSAGTWEVVADVSATLIQSSGASDIRAKLYNVTDAADASTFVLVVLDASTEQEWGNATIAKEITVAAAKQINLHAARIFSGTVTTSLITASRTTLRFKKLR